MRYNTNAVTVLVLLICGWASLVLALTPEEVLALKKAGVGDETIRMMMQQEKEAKVSAKDQTMGRQEVRNSRGEFSIEYSTGPKMPTGVRDAEQQKMDRAWEMLQHLIVDTRKIK
jgi:hypothetical protein